MTLSSRRSLYLELFCAYLLHWPSLWTMLTTYFKLRYRSPLKGNSKQNFVFQISSVDSYSNFELAKNSNISPGLSGSHALFIMV